MNVVEAQSERRQSPTKTPSKLRGIAMIAVGTPWSLHDMNNITFIIAISRRFVKFNNAVQTQWKRILVWQGLYLYIERIKISY
jgi:hypothetical protein